MLELGETTPIQMAYLNREHGDVGHMEDSVPVRNVAKIPTLQLHQTPRPTLLFLSLELLKQALALPADQTLGRRGDRPINGRGKAVLMGFWEQLKVWLGRLDAGFHRFSEMVKRDKIDEDKG